MDNATKDLIVQAVKEAAGEVRAEMVKECEKFAETLEKRYGDVKTANALGVQTNFFKHVGADQPRGHSMRSKGGENVQVGRFLRVLAGARGNLEAALNYTKQAKDGPMQAMVERVIENRQKAMAYADFSAGGALVPEEFSNDVIDLLYPSLALVELGAETLPMPNGNLTIPFLDSGVTAYYVGETQNITPSQQVTGQLQLTAKKLAAIVPISNDLLRTPSARADRFVQNDMLRRLKVRADLAFIRGSGASGEPKGVRNWAQNTAAMTGTGVLAEKVADLGYLQRIVQEQNVPQENPGYIFSPRTEWALRNQLDGLGNFVFARQMEAGMLMGVPFKSTTNIPNTLGAGSDSEIIYGAFGHVLIADTENIEVTAHPDGAYYDGAAVQAGVSNDVTPMRAIARHDLGCRYRGKEIAVKTGITWA